MADFAVIKIGGKQEVVREGEELLVNRLSGKAKDKFTIEEVLLTSIKDKVEIGAPNVKGAKVEAVIVEHTRGEKVVKQTYKAKARQRRKVGHRQDLTKIKITKI